MISDYPQQIKQAVSMRDCLREYGFEVNRAGFCLCPFHGEKTPSMKVHDDYLHCFGCGWSGDIFQFVQEYFHIDFKAALSKINVDFGLNLPLDRKPTLREEAEAERRHRERLAEAAKKEAYDKLYASLWGEYARLDKQRMKYAPRDMNDDISPLYAEAVQALDNIKYQIDTLL